MVTSSGTGPLGRGREGWMGENIIKGMVRTDHRKGKWSKEETIEPGPEPNLSIKPIPETARVYSP